MITALLNLAVLNSPQKYEAVFVVESQSADGSTARTGTSTWSGNVGVHGERNIVWTFKSNDEKNGWRREFTYDEKGELTFESYEVAFGDLKSRWNLARNDGAWKLTGALGEPPLPKSLRLQDPTFQWFKLKKVNPGTQVRISAFDSSTLKARPGQAKFVRTDNVTIGNKPTKVNVLEKRFEDAIEVFYMTETGTPVRIDLIHPKAGTSLSFRTESP